MDINALANQVLTQNWVRLGKTLPVNAFFLADALGLKLAVELEGVGRFDENSKTIFFNPLMPSHHQNFSVAHQLGHFLLNHSNVPAETPSHFLSNSLDPKEREANFFAVSVLMPKGSVQLLLIDQGLTDISLIAAHFNVSEVLCTYRLRQLGYLSR